MKKKELKSLATRIAKAEKIISENIDSQAVYEAKKTVMDLMERVNSTDDMVVLDEMIQEILEKN